MMDDELAQGRPPRITAGEGRLPFEGEDMGRILSLSDGIFAFAMTLLVLYLTLPPGLTSAGLAHYLAVERGPFVAYLVGFLIIGSFWVGHHRVFRHLRRWDTLLLWLNLATLLTVAVQPFVISVYMATGPTFLSVLLVAGAWAISGGFLTAMWLYATRGRRLVDRSLTNTYVERYTQTLVVTPVIFAISIGVAVVNASFAEYLWVVGIVGQALLRRSIYRESHGGSDALPPATS